MKSSNCSNCSTEGYCPFALNEHSEEAQDYGCLPTRMEIISMRQIYGKTWACHDNPKKPCLGALEIQKNNGLDYKVIDSKLLTLDDPWHLYCEERYEPDKPLKYI